MLDSLFQSFISYTEPRATLSSLNKQSIDSNETIHSFLKNHSKHISFYLNHEDKKVRKNMANLLSNYRDDDFKQELIIRYDREDVEFVKCAILEALKKQDMSLDVLWLTNTYKSIEITQDQNIKYHLEKRRYLCEMLSSFHQPVFTQLDKKYPILLTTLKDKQDLLINQLKDKECKKGNQGVLVHTDNLSSIFNIRCFNEMYFLFQPLLKVKNDEESVIKALTHPNVLQFLNKTHQHKLPFLFRIEGYECIKDAKGLIDRVEISSKGLLVNSTTNYSLMFIIKELKDNHLAIYLQLMTIDDPRFKYRQHSISTSLHPFVAATLLEEIKDYLVNEARVLDPFCGVGTLLIERSKCSRTRFLMGVDIYGEAIKKAKSNAENANIGIHYVQRDITTFSNDQPFDEVLTFMPSFNKKPKEMSLIYDRFFKKLPNLLVKKGYAFILTEEANYVYRLLRLHENKIACLKESTYLRGRLHLTLFILRIK